tara:strand:+ start:105 stop:332 length:228 start_codon:yes stop_codon:yes gene_type:complete
VPVSASLTLTCQVEIPGAFKMSMRPETRQSMEMLFHAKWNLPKAAKNANLTDKEMKITFNEYCAFHPPTWEQEEE